MTKSDILKNNLVSAMEASLGVITTACKACGCSRETYHKYYREDENFRNRIDELSSVALDFVESQQFKLIQGVKVKDKNGNVTYTTKPCGQSIRFYLETKGKSRGYVKRTEVDQPITPEQPFRSERTPITFGQQEGHKIKKDEGK